MGKLFTPLQLTTSTLPFWIATLFDPQEDDPMWTLTDFPVFTGYFPFMVHVQFWLFVHRCYQDAFSFHPSPFVYIHRFPPGASTPDESFYFCLEMAPPSIESRSSQKCPHIILRESRSDIKHQFYGLVIVISPQLLMLPPMRLNFYVIHDDLTITTHRSTIEVDLPANICWITGYRPIPPSSG